MLTDRKVRLEETLADLRSTKADLSAHLHRATITDERVSEIEAFCAEVPAGLDHATFEDKRRYFELLDERGIRQVQTRRATSVSCSNIAFTK